MAISSSAEQDYDPEIGEDIPSEADLAGGEPEPTEAETIEARARQMGWHPLSEYRGPSGKWVDAATFVERGETILPIMRANNRRMEEQLERQGGELTELRRTVADQTQVLGEMRDLAKRANEQGYQRARRELIEQRDAAVAAGDTTVFKQVDEQITELETSRAEAVRVPEKVTETPVPTAVPVEIQAFADSNPWWNKDAFLSRQMIAEHEKVITRHPGATLAQQLDLALTNLKREFPDKFGITEEELPDPAPRARPRAAAVSAPSGSIQTPRRADNGINTITDPEERRQAKDAYARAKKLMPDFTEQEYMAIYNDPKADVVELRRSRANGRA